ncbi:MAG: polyprenyl synthetase family protein [Burkholderiales bacterium]|nr:polyprenyl synthetase family protein [Burkholderiales bacterium]
MARVQTRVENALERSLPRADIVPARLHEAMRYAVLGGGKRVRPLLAHAAGEAAAGDIDEALLVRLDTVSCAVELIHAYSLVHDDLPCMDDDVLRRGKPTVHMEYDEASALLVGDSLQSLAFQLLAEQPLAAPAAQLEMVKALAVAIGSRGMAGGQAIDLASVGQSLTIPELELMHIHKTGALIRASVSLGAMCAEPMSQAVLAGLDQYARLIGLAFQVVDDVLDAESTTATLGKTAGKDAADDKPTYVKAMGLARAKALATGLRGDALAAIEGLGPRARRLAELADFIVLRKF